MVLPCCTKDLPKLQIRNIYKRHLLNHWSKFKLFHRIFPHDAFYQNSTNDSAPRNKGAARPLDKKCLLMTFPPETLAQFQKYLTELFHIMPFSKIRKKVPLHWTKGLPELQIWNIFKRHKRWMMYVETVLLSTQSICFSLQEYEMLKVSYWDQSMSRPSYLPKKLLQKSTPIPRHQF